MKLVRFSDNPIISPTQNWWEINATFNPAATVLNGKVALLYRAVGGDSFSRFGLAESQAGYKFDRFDEPILEADTNNPYERLGIEDPRITQIDGVCYIVYNAASVYPASEYKTKKFAPSLYHPAPWRVRPELITTTDLQNFKRHGVLLERDTKDCLLFPEKIAGKFILAHRTYPNLYLIFSQNLNSWENEVVLISPRSGHWDSERVGAGAPPLRTEFGWLMLYHGTDDKHIYRLGFLLLDLTDPTKVIYRSEEPILSPEREYEKVGLTPNVVFSCAMIELSGKYLVYYGAADKVIGVAEVSKVDLLIYLNDELARNRR